jgi:hypothetical protein
MEEVRANQGAVPLPERNWSHLVERAAGAVAEIVPTSIDRFRNGTRLCRGCTSPPRCCWTAGVSSWRLFFQNLRFSSKNAPFDFFFLIFLEMTLNVLSLLNLLGLSGLILSLHDDAHFFFFALNVRELMILLAHPFTFDSSMRLFRLIETSLLFFVFFIIGLKRGQLCHFRPKRLSTAIRRVTGTPATAPSFCPSNRPTFSTYMTYISSFLPPLPRPL